MNQQHGEHNLTIPLNLPAWVAPVALWVTSVGLLSWATILTGPSGTRAWALLAGLAGATWTTVNVVERLRRSIMEVIRLTDPTIAEADDVDDDDPPTPIRGREAK